MVVGAVKESLKTFVRFAFFVIGFVVSFSLQAQTDCVLKKDVDSVKVYTCRDTHSQFKALSSTFTLNATLSELSAILLDAENYKEWQYHTIESKILKKINDREMIYHMVVAAPWPVSNRDLVVHFTIAEDVATKTVTVTANSEPTFIPHIKGIVRVPASTSKWVVTAEGPQKLRVVYTMLVDPGGAIPAWLANMVVVQAPFESFENLKARIKKGKPGLPKAAFILD